MPATADKLLPIEAVAALLSVEVDCVSEWVEEGIFPSPVPLPDGRFRWYQSEISAWMTLLRMQKQNQEGTSKGTTRAQPGHNQGTTKNPEKRLPAKAVAVLHFLRGENSWFTAEEIVGEVSPESSATSGYWKKLMADLVTRGLLDSDRSHGFRITEEGKKLDV